MRKRFSQLPKLASVEVRDKDNLIVTFQSAERRLLELDSAEEQFGESLPRGPVRINEWGALEWPEAPIKLEKVGSLIEYIDVPQSRYSLGADTVRQLSVPLEPDFRQVLGRQLKSLRKELGLSQLDVANRIGTQRTYISHIENGHSDLEIQSLKRIVEVGLGRELEISIR
jgi:DNA-binding XRE family transcriptional regulator